MSGSAYESNDSSKNNVIQGKLTDAVLKPYYCSNIMPSLKPCALHKLILSR